MPPEPGFLGRSALIVAHPGHELRLHGWLETVRPVVSILTDGSGGASTPRIESSRKLLARLDCTLTGVAGRFSDRALYRAILERNVRPVADCVVEISDTLLEDRVETVVTDSCEFYNPVHDLCRVIAGLVVEQMETIGGSRPELFEYGVVNELPSSGEGGVELVLDDAALVRKLASAAAYSELRQEVEGAVSRRGERALATERLHRIPRNGTSCVPHERPEYERYGEIQVAAGRYPEVLRYREHFAPFVSELAKAVRSPHLAGRSQVSR